MSWRDRRKAVQPKQRTYRCRCGAVALSIQAGQPLCETCKPLPKEEDLK